jgi:protein TonB
MFQGTLLESAPVVGRRSRWPMATGFTVQMIVASALVILPLLSTGIIPLSTSMPVFVPARYTPIETAEPESSAGSHSNAMQPARRSYVALNNNRSHISDPFAQPSSTTGDSTATTPDLSLSSRSGSSMDAMPVGRVVPVPPPVKPHGPVKISEISEAMLQNKVLPVYPVPAARAGIQGNVKLHAIIATDGSIQSLSVIAGHPLLTRAALDAVSQWRYKPYFLNGSAIEVETYITVTFRRE